MAEPDTWDGGAPSPPRQSGVLACCSTLYAHPIAELLLGESLHPGGLAGTRALLCDAALAPGTRLLDAGCGLGASARLAADEFGLAVDGVDASEEVLALAAARGSGGRIRWTLADIGALPFESGVFNAVLAECVLSTAARQVVLAELARVLRPGGTLVLSDMVVRQGAIPTLLGHELIGAALCVTAAWRPGEVEERLPAAGFHITRHRDHSASILSLVDRAEARLRVAATAARDLGLGTAGLFPAQAGLKELDGVRPRRLADEVQDAVARGDLRYVSVLAVRT